MFNIFSRKEKSPATLCFRTDIHCHVIPGVDDGSRNVETSVELIEAMQGFGIERIIASPHVTQESFENNSSTIDPALDLLHNELRRRGNNIEISHSAEYRIDDLFLQRLENNELMLLPNNHIIIRIATMLCMRQVCGSRSIFSASPKHTAKTNAPSLSISSKTALWILSGPTSIIPGISRQSTII